jgi:hypothetical protein
MPINIDALDVFTLIISIIALLATIRKKDYGTFYFISKKEKQDNTWIKVIKSDLYDLKITFEPYKNMQLRITMYNPEDNSESLLDFIKEVQPIFELGFLKENCTLKLNSCNCSIIHIEYRDKYNNLYRQSLTKNKISKRTHINFWNLTFVGS